MSFPLASSAVAPGSFQCSYGGTTSSFGPFRVIVGQLRFVLEAVFSGVGSTVGGKVGDVDGAAGLARSIPGVQVLSLTQSQAPAGQEFCSATLAKHDSSPPLLDLQGLLRMIH